MANAIWDLPNSGFGGVPNPASQQQQWPSGASGSSTGQSGSNSLFYNPSGNYGQNQDWFNSPIGQNMREQNQQLAYGAYGQNLGIGNNDQSFNQWFYKQYPRFQQAYGMATMQNPMLTVDQFLATLPGMQQLMGQYNSQSAAARGETPQRYAQNARWVPR